MQMTGAVANKRHLHEIGLRNGWFLPPCKSGFVTVDYIQQVRSGAVYCPRFEDVRLRPCPVRPPLALVLTEVLRACQQRKLRIGDCSRGSPGKDWLLKVLSTLEPLCARSVPASHRRADEVGRLPLPGG